MIYPKNATIKEFIMFKDRFLRHERFFHEPRRESRFQKGDLKYVVLDLLKEKSRYGYEIIRALEEQSHGLYTPSPGVVYPTLQMLEEMGHASSQELDGKRIYTITEQGLQFLDERKDSADEVRSQMKNRWSFKNIGRMAMVMKEYHALDNVLGRRLFGTDPEKLKRIQEVLAQAHDDIESILEE
jgi:DNA-binding PadR family transcriptional regulator